MKPRNICKLNKFKKKRAFTLVELIIVITILIILATIAYVFVNEYIADSRDSKRITDIRNISNTIERFTAKWKNPAWLIENPTIQTYSWWVLFKQWDINIEMWRKLEEISQIPTDPITNEYYKYSATNNGTQYQIFSKLEKGNLINWIVNKTYAAWEETKIYKIIWNYGWLFLIWDNGKYYSVPSLFIDERWIDTEWYAWFYLDWKTELTRYQIKELAPIKPINDDMVYDFTIKIYNSYMWTAINEWVFRPLDINDREKVIDFWRLLLWWKITSSWNLEEWDCLVNNNIVIRNGEFKTLFKEENPLLLCEQQDITCIDWTLTWSIDYEDYIYSSCSTFTVTNCDPTIYNFPNTTPTHIYNLPAVNHTETATWITSAEVSENNWIFTYTLDSIKCNDGTWIEETENPTPTWVSCDSWYTQSWSTCVISWDVTLTWVDTVTCSWCQ